VDNTLEREENINMKILVTRRLLFSFVYRVTACFNLERKIQQLQFREIRVDITLSQKSPRKRISRYEKYDFSG